MRSLKPLAIPLLASTLAVACSDAPPPIDTGVRTRTSAQLRAYESCDALTVELRQNTRERVRTLLLQQREMMRSNDGGWWFGGPEVDAAAPEADGAGRNSGRQEGVDFSGTNNQEAGVDESDLAKTDGYHLYVINGGQLVTMAIPEFGQLEPRSSLDIEGHPQQLLLAGPRAVVFSSVYRDDRVRDDVRDRIMIDDDGAPRGQLLTKLTVVSFVAGYDQPQVERELYIEGSMLTGRRVDDVVRLATYAWFDLPGLKTWLDVPYTFWEEVNEDARHAAIDEAFRAAMAENDTILARADAADFVPRLFERQGGQLVERPLAADGCQNVSIPDDGMAAGFTSIITLGLNLGETASLTSVEADHVVSNTPILYSSTDTLLLAEPAQDWWWYWGADEIDEATNIHRFDLSGIRTTYTGSGRVEGTLLGQFALDAHDDVVRVAATKGQWNRWWMEEPAPAVTHLVTLGGSDRLETLGSVDGIAPNERLWSVRFTDDEAYLVTFQNIDPLWTIDLSDVRAPRVLGELHVPGVSTYIHPLGDQLLTIGIAGDDNGLDWGVTQLSMFDIADRTDPTLATSLRLSAGETRDGWQYGYSEATWEHKAFTYWGPQATLAIPLSTWRYSDRGDYEYKSELILAHVEEGQPLAVSGRVDHSDLYNLDHDAWWDFRDIRRSYFMGDYLYAVSDKGVTCHRLSDLEETAVVPLPGTVYDGYGW